MDDETLAQKRTELADLYTLIRAKTAAATELTDDAAGLVKEASELAREILAEEDRRRDYPGTVHPLFPNGPTDQGSC